MKTKTKKEKKYNKEFIDLLMDKAQNKRVYLWTIDGIGEYDVDAFIRQPIQGILYDLNRGLEVTATLLEAKNPNKRLLNDFAVAVVIKRLKERLEEECSHIYNQGKNLCICKKCGKVVDISGKKRKKK